MGSVVSAFHAGPTGEVAAVELKGTGERLRADLVIVGSGIIPATEYLAAAEGVELVKKAPGGVRTDEFLRIAPDVYAAGDIAYFPYAYAADPSCGLVRIEHYDVAMDQVRLRMGGGEWGGVPTHASCPRLPQGRVAAQNMLGMRVRYEGVPFFWTAQFGKTIRYAGYASKPDDVVIHGSISAPLAEVSFTVFYILGERVAAVATFNRDPQAVAAMELLRLGEMPSPRQLRGVDSLDLQVWPPSMRQASAGSSEIHGFRPLDAGIPQATRGCGRREASRASGWWGFDHGLMV